MLKKTCILNFLSKWPILLHTQHWLQPALTAVVQQSRICISRTGKVICILFRYAIFDLLYVRRFVRSESLCWFLCVGGGAYVWKIFTLEFRFYDVFFFLGKTCAFVYLYHGRSYPRLLVAFRVCECGWWWKNESATSMTPKSGSGPYIAKFDDNLLQVTLLFEIRCMRECGSFPIRMYYMYVWAFPGYLTSSAT